MSENKIAYFELPSTDVATLKAFYGRLFGWTFQDFGDDYSTMEGAGLEGGFNGDPVSKSKAPMVMIETTDIGQVSKQVQAAGERSQGKSLNILEGSAFTSATQMETNWRCSSQRISF